MADRMLVISVDAARVFEVTEKDQKGFPVYGFAAIVAATETLSVCRGVRYNLKSPDRLDCIFREPSDMCPTDRIMLYVDQCNLSRLPVDPEHRCSGANVQP